MPTEFHNVEPEVPHPLRRYSRNIKQRAHLQNYICNHTQTSECNHSLTNLCILTSSTPNSYSLQSSSQISLHTTNDHFEPAFYNQSRSNPHWEDVMNIELQAFQLKNT